MIEIPQFLLAASAAFEAAKARQAAIAGAASTIGAEGAAAVARRAEIGAEIARRRGAILKEKALLKAAIVGDVRMTARDIAAAERELTALAAECDQLQSKIEEAEAGRLALADEIAAADAEVLAAARAFVAEHRRLDAELAIEFARDVGRLVLPELLRKWSAVGDGRIDQRLASLSIANFSGVTWDGCSDIGAPGAAHGHLPRPGAGWRRLEKFLAVRPRSCRPARRARRAADIAAASRGDDRRRQGTAGHDGRARKAGRAAAPPGRISAGGRQHGPPRAGHDAARVRRPCAAAASDRTGSRGSGLISAGGARRK